MARKRIECCMNFIRNVLIISIIIIIICAYKARKLHRADVASQIPKEALKYIFFKKTSLSHQQDKYNINFLSELNNQQEKILNEDTYGPVEKDTTIFVITVHKLSIYLEFLLVSLSQVRGIEKALIIFSHSRFDDNVNNLIRSIDFARVLQIYFPHSIQIYPNEFPGFHPLDCPYDMDMQDAEKMNCTGAFHPDIHGRYRNPSKTETKHHWWWTANMVFDTLTSTRNHTGTIIFLDDDVFLLQDFIYLIMYMQQIVEFLPKYDLLSLDARPDVNKLNAYRIDIKKWKPTDHPAVLAFDVTTWRSIVSHYDLFCSIDDYSWARSLYFVSLNRRDGSPYNVMSPAMARAFKTSNCGFDAKLVDCDAIESLFQVLNLQKQMKYELFPPFLEVYMKIDVEDVFESIDYNEINGGWNDPRDKELCREFTKQK